MNYFVILAIALFAYMNLWFIASLIKKRNDIADIAWGLGFTLLAWTSLYIAGDFGTRGLVVSILVSIWGLRLAFHIYKRNRGKDEDYRYLEWRKAWGKWFYLRSYLQVYLLQGLLLFLIVMPVLFINRNTGSSVNYLDILGILIWAIGFIFEVIGDAQLVKFIKNPENKDKLMQSGLWKYTRHPNYFGEVTQWWGIWIIALSVADGWMTIIGPLTITVLILKVSGIPMLEKNMAKKPGFAEYKRQTSIFLPWFSKKL